MSRARIDLLTPPFAGHLHPMLGIALALAAEFDVRVISTAAARERIEAAGVPGLALLPGVDAELRAFSDPVRPTGSDPRKLARQFRRTLRLLAAFDGALAEFYRSERPALLIADFTLPVAGGVAARLGIPWWTSHPSPCVIEAPGGPPAYVGGWSPGRGALGRARDACTALAIRGFKRCVHALHRRELAALGFPAVYRADGSEAAYSAERVLALGLRELEFARAWPARVDFVGPVLWTPPGRSPECAPPVGRRPVLATLGTHLGRARAAFAAELERLARERTELALHFSAGAYEGEQRAEGGALTRSAWVDYARWIPRMSAVVHHGGTGVLYECLRAGVPSVVWPNDYDQFDHAARLVSARVGVRLRRLDRLGEELERVLAGRAGLEPRRFVSALRPGLAEARILAAVRARLGA